MPLVLGNSYAFQRAPLYQLAQKYPYPQTFPYFEAQFAPALMQKAGNEGQQSITGSHSQVNCQ
jgi:hypothetical protein